MKKFFIAAALVAAVAAPANADPISDMRTDRLKSVLNGKTSSETIPKELASAVDLWNPSVIVLDKGQLIIGLPQKRITDQIYASVMGSGLCMDAVGNDKPWGGVQVKEVFVMNEFLAQGYVFMGGPNDCKDLGFMGKEFEVKLMGKTRVETCVSDLNECLGR